MAISACGMIDVALLPLVYILWLYKCHSHIQYKFTSNPQVKACGAGSATRCLWRIFQNCHSENRTFSQSGPKVWECLWKAFEVLGATCYQTAQAIFSGALTLYVLPLRFQDIWEIKRSGMILQVPDHIPEQSFHFITEAVILLGEGLVFLKGSLEGNL